MQKIILQKIIVFAKILWPGLVVLYCRYHCFHDIRDPLFCLSILIQTDKGALFISSKTLLWYALKHSSIFSMIHIAAENRLTYDFWEKRCHVWAGISYSIRVFVNWRLTSSTDVHIKEILQSYEFFIWEKQCQTIAVLKLNISHEAWNYNTNRNNM